MICHHCGLEVITGRSVGRQETCRNCHSYLHSCLNCTFHDPVAYHECREPSAIWVKEKENGNFCEYFSPRTKVEAAGANGRSDAARRKLDELFGKKED